MQKRIDYLDTAKGIAIIAVVMSHAISNSGNIALLDHPVLLNWLSFFNVSTFFFINGFLYNESCINSPIKSISKKVKAYYFPFLKFNLFFFLFQNLFVQLHILDESYRINGLKNFIIELFKLLFGKMQPLTGPMWFLRSLILLSIMYILTDYFSSRIFQGKYRYLINGIVAIILWKLSKYSKTPTTFNLPSACEGFFLFYLGVLYKKFNVNDFIKKYLYPTGLLSFTISVIIGNTIMVGIYGHLNDPLDIISMIVSVIFVISISQISFISNIKSLKYIGKCSLEIMALHFFAFKPVSLILIKVYNLDISYLGNLPVVMITGLSVIWPILYSISGIILPAAYCAITASLIARVKRH